MRNLFFTTIYLSMLTLTGCVKNNKEVVVIAHRGHSGHLPEHTLEAWAMAHASGAHYIEPDLVLTKDQELIVLHDHHLDTTTNVAQIFPKRHRVDGRYYAIDFTLPEIKSLTVSSRFDPTTKKAIFPKRFPVGHGDFFKIPTFKECLTLLKGMNQASGLEVGIYVEMKAYKFHLEHGVNIADKLMQVLNEYGYRGPNKKIFIQSFDPNALKYLKEKHQTKIPLTQLIAMNEWQETNTDYTEMVTYNGLKAVKTYADHIGPSLGHIFVDNMKKDKPTQTPLMKIAKEVGLKVHVYTFREDQLPSYVNTFDELHDLFINYVEVDGVFSDFPDFTASFVKNN